MLRLASDLTHDHAAPDARCKACQLQLCKGRGERPHAALKETSRIRTDPASIDFKCDSCGAVMICSADLAKSGWSHRR